MADKKFTETQRLALKHPDRPGAGAKRRRHFHLRGKDKVRVVMHEWKRGTLRSGSGQKVKNYKQAVAIALSEAGLSRDKKKKQ